MSVLERVRGVIPYLVIAAFIVAFGVFMLERTGVISETIVIRDPAVLSGDEAGEGRSLQLVTLLPKDGIPAIFNPKFLPADEGASQFAPDDLVIGVVIGGEARAYGVAFLSSHEIVNDVLGGRPIAVTW